MNQLEHILNGFYAYFTLPSLSALWATPGHINSSHKTVDLLLFALCLLTVFVFIAFKQRQRQTQQMPPSAPEKSAHLYENLNENLIQSAIENIWQASEDYIHEFYERLNQQNFTNTEKLCEYLADTYREAVSGQFLGYKMMRPFDLTIWAMDAERKVLYHPYEYYVGTRLHNLSLYDPVQKSDEGEFTILDHYRSKQLDKFAKKSLKGNRLTKVYFKRIEALKVTVVFENHINLVNRIRQTNLNSIDKQIKSQVGGTLSSYELRIFKAIYRGKSNELDVTDLLLQKTSNNIIDLEITNKVFGDPDPGYIKTLEVDYAINQTEFKALFEEGERLYLP